MTPVRCNWKEDKASALSSGFVRQVAVSAPGMRTLRGCSGFLRSPSRLDMGLRKREQSKIAAAVGFEAAATAVTCDVATSHMAFDISMTPQRLCRRWLSSAATVGQGTEVQNIALQNSYSVRARHEVLNPRLFASRKTPQHRPHTATATPMTR